MYNYNIISKLYLSTIAPQKCRGIFTNSWLCRYRTITAKQNWYLNVAQNNKFSLKHHKIKNDTRLWCGIALSLPEWTRTVISESPNVSISFVTTFWETPVHLTLQICKNGLVTCTLNFLQCTGFPPTHPRNLIKWLPNREHRKFLETILLLLGSFTSSTLPIPGWFWLQPPWSYRNKDESIRLGFKR